MTDFPRYFVNFIADNGQTWQNEYAPFVPRVGDMIYPYEIVDGVYRVEEVWMVGEKRGRADFGTNVFVTRVPMQGSRLQEIWPEYYTGD